MHRYRKIRVRNPLLRQLYQMQSPVRLMSRNGDSLRRRDTCFGSNKSDSDFPILRFKPNIDHGWIIEFGSIQEAVNLLGSLRLIELYLTWNSNVRQIWKTTLVWSPALSTFVWKSITSCSLRSQIDQIKNLAVMMTGYKSHKWFKSWAIRLSGTVQWEQR